MREDAAPNPVLLLPAGWPLVARLTGDRGLGPLLAADPDRVVRVAVPGANPDVDTPADLAALAAVPPPAPPPRPGGPPPPPPPGWGGGGRAAGPPPGGD